MKSSKMLMPLDNVKGELLLLFIRKRVREIKKVFLGEEYGKIVLWLMFISQRKFLNLKEAGYVY